MSFNIFLIQLVGFSCGLMLLRSPALPKGWRIVSGCILGVLGCSFLIAPDLAGWVGGCLWLVLVLLPLVGAGIVSRLVMRERYKQACRIASFVRWLHPFDGAIEYPALLKGLELGQQGRMDEAQQVFQRYQTTKTATGRMATTLLYRLGARWDELVTWVHNQLPENIVLIDGTVGAIYLRSLGEIGDLNGLLQGLERLRKVEKVDANWLRMLALAFCGQVERVQKAFNGPLSTYSDNTRQFWLATAELAAGNELTARQQLMELRDRSDTVQRNAIDWRLTHPLAKSNQRLTDSSKSILIWLRTEMRQESQYSFRSLPKGRKAYATYVLIAANCILFAIEQKLGGSEDTSILYRLGALVPKTVFAGEWWRVLSANFLHLNLLHLLTNLLGLYVLGRFVERSLGISKFLIAYFASGIGAMLMIAVLAVLANVPDLLCVGASGAIMGLLGVIAATLLRGWQREKARVARNQLGWILSLVGLQVVSDLMIPESSMVGHVSGLIIGFLVGYFLSTGPRGLK